MSSHDSHESAEDANSLTFDIEERKTEVLKPKAPKPMRRGSVSCRQSVVLPRLPRLEGLPLEFPEMEAIPEEPRVLYRTNKVDSIS